jgi:ElaB/YqjD/DUF883 family membrane-anchored ribosome-binding protein
MTEDATRTLIDELRAVIADAEALEAQLSAGAKRIALDTEAYIRSNPWPAVGLAAAAGICVGLLLNRR